MKKIWIVGVWSIAFLSFSTLKAQTSAPGASVNQHAEQHLKFIDHIEIIPTAGPSAAIIEPGVNYSSKIESTNLNRTQAVGLTIENCSAIQFKYALMLDVEVELIRDLNLFAFIEEWWGTNYKYGGSDKDGIDCSAFCGKLAEAVYQKVLPRTAREQYAASSRLTREELTEGDLVFFNTRGGVSHVGLYLGNNYFVHSSTNKGVIISSLNDDYYNRKFIGGGRMLD